MDPTLPRLGVVVLSGCRVDLDSRRAVWPDGDRQLTPNEAKLLAFMRDLDSRSVTKEELLEQVWDYRPGVISRTVKTTVSRLRSKIERDPSEPEHLLTVPGVGYRLLCEEPTYAGPAPGAEEQPRGPAAGNVDGRGPELLGRDEALELLRTQLIDGAGRLVTVVGPGGVGKTALAQRIAAEAAAEGAAREVWFVPLEGCRTEEDLLGRTAVVLGIEEPEETQEARRAAFAARLRRRGSVLLVLDDLEGSVAPAARLVAAWIEACPEARFLATSREALRLGPEQLLRLDGLDADGAADLLERRLGPESLDGWTDRGRTAPVLTALDRVPLSIEMVAAWADMLTPEAVERRLDEQLDLLALERRDVPERHRSLRAVMQASWALLPESARTLLRSAAVFETAFDLDAAERVLGPAASPAPVAAALRGLRDRSLLHAEPPSRSGKPRFRLFSAVRAFAREQGVPEEARRDAIRWFARWGEPATLAELEARGGADRSGALGRELRDIRACAAAALSRDDLVHAVPLVRATLAHAALVGRAAVDPTPVRELLGRPLEPQERGAVLLEWALTLAVSGGPEARRLSDQALKVALDGGLGALEARARRHIAESLLVSDPSAGPEQAGAAVDAARGLDDPALLGQCLLTLARAEGLVGHRRPADEALDEARRLLREAGHRRGEALALATLGESEEARGRPRLARAYLDEALRLAEAVADRGLEARVTASIGRVQTEAGRPEEAIALLEKAVVGFRRLGRHPDEARAQVALGTALLVAGRLEAARGALEEGLVGVRDEEDHRWTALALGRLGELHGQRGEYERALRRLDEAVALARREGLPRAAGTFAGARGLATFEQGDVDDGRARLEEAVNELQAAEERRELVRLLERWADAEAAAGDDELSAALLRRADQASELTYADSLVAMKLR